MTLWRTSPKRRDINVAKAKKSKAPEDLRSPWEKALANELFHHKSKARPRPPPDNRRLNVGDRVRHGRGEHVEVEAWLDPEGISLLLRHWQGDNREAGSPRVVFWNEAMPLTEADPPTFLDADSVDIWRKCSARQSDLQALLWRANWWGVNDTPKYQRDYVWTQADRERLLDSIFAGLDIGKFVFILHAWPENRIEVLDGKQRLSALMDFYESRWAYRGVYFHELQWKDRYTILNHSTQWIDIDASKASESELLRLFLAVNAGGVPQTDDHIKHVRALYEAALLAEGK